MLGVISENRLKNFLVAVGDGEREIEASRQRLCSIRDFALMAAFERFDRNLSGNVDGRELNDFLRENGVLTITDSECDALVRYFDNNGDGKLVFNEFIQLWLPCEDNVLRSITSDRPSIRVGRFDRLPVDIELAMVRVIEGEINLQRRLESLKRECLLGLDFSSLAALRSIDRYNTGTFNTVLLGAFLRS
jgi:hypothetical protein